MYGNGLLHYYEVSSKQCGAVPHLGAWVTGPEKPYHPPMPGRRGQVPRWLRPKGEIENQPKGEIEKVELANFRIIYY